MTNPYAASGVASFPTFQRPETRNRGGGRPMTISPEAVRDIRARRAAGENGRLIAVSHGIAPSMVYDIAENRIYRRVA